MKSYTVLVSSVLLLGALAQGARGEDSDNATEMESIATARLERALPMLGDSDPSDRLAAVHQLVDLAGSRFPSAGEAKRLLIRATADSDPEIASLAMRALDRLDHPAEPEPGSDEEVRKRAEERRLEWVAEVLSRPEGADQDTGDRLAATQILVHLASGSRLWSPDLAWLVDLAKRDANLEVASLAEQVLAEQEGRSIDPRFARPVTRSQEGAENPSESERRASAVYEATEDPNPEIRLASLHWVLDIALSEGAASDPRILTSLIARRDDPDPRVASFVRVALADLSGNAKTSDETRADLGE